MICTRSSYFREQWNGGKSVSSDGFVPVASQKWKPSLRAATGTAKNISQKEFPFPVDHLNQCRWWDWQERHGFFDPSSPYNKKRVRRKVKAVYPEIVLSVRHPSDFSDLNI